MRIMIGTDMEGVAGVIDHDTWVTPEGRYYERGKELLTREVNAAIEGFFEAGAEYILVSDGHGYGGLTLELLDRRVDYRRGWSPVPYPGGLENNFDCYAVIGQHPKAGTEYGHISHTGWFNVIDKRLNGISIGEFGTAVFICSELGVTPIFGSGDLAFTKEAQALVPGIETVAVKRGLTPGTGIECDTDQYRNRNLAAEHIHPERAREMIKKGAYDALTRFINDPKSFQVPKLDPPYILEMETRKNGDIPPRYSKWEHPSSIIGVFNMPYGGK
ncbi:MAG: M55 family metallopeptidase [Clostridia bacterium]|jgi:D-amino peptidase